MKILCVADHKDPLVYSPNIKERFKDVDIVLGAGDLDVAYYEYIVSCLNKPLLFVFGNHNLKLLNHFCGGGTVNNFQENPNTGFFGSLCVDGRVIRDKKRDLIVAGLGGALRYNWGKHQFTDKWMRIRALKMFPRLLINRIFHGRWLDILLTHAPPRGIHDREDLTHRGFSSFLWFIKTFKPRYLIHGHVHLYDINAKRRTLWEGTLIVNAYDHTVIDTEKKHG